tara:strand:+ start:5773 stop:5937 length:165 start_codon:yes stop_codon:yes gene_type:complete
MIKYKRRTINQKADLHNKEFVVYEDMIEIMSLLAREAVKAGADESKLMEFFDNE